MREMKPLEKIVIEEMAERAVADVMGKGGDPEEFFHIVGRRDIRRGFCKKWIEMPGEAPGDMHRAERMDEAAVLGRWIDPSRALKLIDVTQPLHPRRVNEVLLGGLRRPHGLLSDSTEGNGKRDVFMDGVCDERRPLVLQGAE